MSDDEFDAMIAAALDQFVRSLETVTVLTLTLTFMGKTSTHTLAAPLDGRDPMEMTLGEWMACPVLTADAMLERVLEEHRQ